LNTIFQADAVNAFNPAAAVEGKTGPLRDGDEPAGVRVSDEDIVQIDRLVAGGQQHLDGDGGGDAHPFHLSHYITCHTRGWDWHDDKKGLSHMSDYVIMKWLKRATEGSHSGLVRAPAKRFPWVTGDVGSNPTPSAINYIFKEEDDGCYY
jgi:hypothetical protein